MSCKQQVLSKYLQMDEWMLSAKLDCLMFWKFPAVQDMEVAQDAGRGHLARLSECDG